MKQILFFSLLVSILFSHCKDNDVICLGNPKSDCVCAEIYEPVCGCDGVTYSNPCHADCAGVNEYSPGLCGNAITQSITAFWSFMGYVNEDGVSETMPEKSHNFEVFVDFSDEKNEDNSLKFSGQAAINSFGGDYKTQNEKLINIKNLEHTEKAGNAAENSFEANFFNALNGVTEYTVGNNILIISFTTTTKSDKMVFIKKE